LNKDAKPSKENRSNDVILVIPTEQSLSEGEDYALASYWEAIWRAEIDTASTVLDDAVGPDRAAELKAKYPLFNPSNAIALAAYWKAIWLADGKSTGEEDALTKLKDAVGTDSATKLIEAYSPFNLGERPQNNKKKNEVKSDVAFVVFPTPDQQATKRNSWSQPARVDVMPDCLVLLGYAGGNEVLKKVSDHLIPSPLCVTPDPSGSPGGQVKAENGNLSVGEDIRWMVDFEEAIKSGMGFKITNGDLQGAQLKDGFDRLLVLGIRLSADEQGGKELLQTLLSNHHRSSKGFSLLPQGTPTNNTETGGTSLPMIHSRPT
jgi:hypothetical protein